MNTEQLSLEQLVAIIDQREDIALHEQELLMMGYTPTHNGYKKIVGNLEIHYKKGIKARYYEFQAITKKIVKIKL